MNNSQARDYRKAFNYRVWASGLRDEAFIEQFYEGEEVERSLKSAEIRGHYEEELETLVDLAWGHYERYGLDSLERIHERGTQKGRIPPKKKRRGPQDIAGARERQAALGQYLAREASRYETIISFRKSVLSGRVLSEEEALTFLSSPLAAAKSRAVFRMLGTDPLKRILDTNYHVKEDEDDWGPYRELVWGRRRSSTVRPLGVVVTKLIFPGDVVTQHDIHGMRSQGGPLAIFPHPREEGRFVVTRPSSILGDVVRLAEVSLSGFPISREMGVWFILTGEFIPEDPVRIRYETIQRPYLLSRTTITLEVESWLPPEEVLEQYRHAQQRILGGTPRSLKRRTVALFEFINQHKVKSWREIFDAWNKAHPSQRFRDRSHLYTTYMRARDKIASPPTLSELSLAPAVQRRPQPEQRGT